MIRRALLFTATVGLATGLVTAQEDWEESSPYYEDDAWWDITEWFDGNDYNPENEAGWWQEASYSDTGEEPWGYDQGSAEEDKWFYDYYDDGRATYGDQRSSTSAPSSGSAGGGSAATYSYVYEYYDFDGDGYYDAVDYLADDDQDGEFETAYFFTFGDVEQQHQQQARKASQQRSSKSHQVSGEIVRTKEVSCCDSKHVVAEVKAKEGGKSYLVDLGSVESLEKSRLEEGTSIQASGPMTKVGDKQLVVAQSLSVDGRRHELDRKQREVQGAVASSRKSKLRGEEHMLVVVNPKDGGGSWLVDLGPAKALPASFQEGDMLTAEGTPCRKGNTRILMAESCEMKGKEHDIDRSKAMASGSGSKKEKSGKSDESADHSGESGDSGHGGG